MTANDVAAFVTPTTGGARDRRGGGRAGVGFEWADDQKLPVVFPDIHNDEKGSIALTDRTFAVGGLCVSASLWGDSSLLFEPPHALFKLAENDSMADNRRVIFDDSAPQTDDLISERLFDSHQIRRHIGAERMHLGANVSEVRFQFGLHLRNFTAQVAQKLKNEVLRVTQGLDSSFSASMRRMASGREGLGSISDVQALLNSLDLQLD